MELTLYADAVLVRDVPERRLRAGDVDTVIERHEVPGRQVGYSVEFFDRLGNTVAVVTVPADSLRTTLPTECYDATPLRN